MSIRRPARRTAWSSAIRTRMLDMRATTSHRKAGRDRGPLPARRCDLHRAAEQRRPLLHALKPEAAARRPAPGSKPTPSSCTRSSTVVSSRTSRTLTRRAPACFATLVRASCSTRYTVICNSGSRGSTSSPSIRVSSAIPCSSGKLLHVAGHRHGEPQIVEDARVEPPGQASHVAQRPGGHLPQLLRQLDCLRHGPGLLDRPQSHQERRQRLPGLVVQLAGDPPPAPRPGPSSPARSAGSRSSSCCFRSVASTTTPITPLTCALPANRSGAKVTDTGTGVPSPARTVISPVVRPSTRRLEQRRERRLLGRAARTGAAPSR